MTKQLALAIVAGVIFAGDAHAQTRPKPEDPGAPAQPAAHTSAFDGYRAYRDEPVSPWREVNDAAREAGGHVGVLRAERRDAGRSVSETAQGASGSMPAGSNQGKQEK